MASSAGAGADSVDGACAGAAGTRAVTTGEAAGLATGCHGAVGRRSFKAHDAERNSERVEEMISHIDSIKRYYATSEDSDAKTMLFSKLDKAREDLNVERGGLAARAGLAVCEHMPSAEVQALLESGAVRLLNKSFQRLCSEGVRVERRQDLGDARFASEPSDTGVVSHGWLSRDHPDPTGARCKALSQIKESRVFIDFSSLYQKDHHGRRTKTEQGLFDYALSKMSVLYTEGRWCVYILDYIPPGDENSTPYDQRGWCFFEDSIATCGESEVVGSVFHGLLNPEQFEKELAKKKFTGRGDQGKVCNLYKKIFEEEWAKNQRINAKARDALALINRDFVEEDRPLLSSADRAQLAFGAAAAVGGILMGVTSAMAGALLLPLAPAAAMGVGTKVMTEKKQDDRAMLRVHETLEAIVAARKEYAQNTTTERRSVLDCKRGVLTYIGTRWYQTYMVVRYSTKHGNERLEQDSRHEVPGGGWYGGSLTLEPGAKNVNIKLFVRVIGQIDAVDRSREAVWVTDENEHIVSEEFRLEEADGVEAVFHLAGTAMPRAVTAHVYKVECNRQYEDTSSRLKGEKVSPSLPTFPTESTEEWAIPAAPMPTLGAQRDGRRR